MKHIYIHIRVVTDFTVDILGFSGDLHQSSDTELWSQAAVLESHRNHADCKTSNSNNSCRCDSPLWTTSMPSSKVTTIRRHRKWVVSLKVVSRYETISMLLQKQTESARRKDTESIWTVSCNMGHQWFRLWLFNYSPLRHYPNQCWLDVKWTPEC